ncbi:MAG: Asp-tRNA(Asn)/Glu-tRNA(Gln) amidotransferase subunit GatC [Chloroflexi bacterium]|nr:Asp-tRNA(Asn)/Glu-tRNA(Gln) amidotransferase subunit GatC [Chloroflexota bacterium]
MQLSKEDVLRVAKLARLDLDEQEIERFQSQLSNILHHFSVLSEVDTAGIAPTSQPFDTKNIMRKDLTASSLPTAQILLNAPDLQDDSFKVKAVME